MATTPFDHPLFVRRNCHVEEVASLEDAFDLLESWPAEQRGLAHDTILGACRKAAEGSFPVDAVRVNLERFLRKSGLLAQIDDVPNFTAMSRDWTFGSA